MEVRGHLAEELEAASDFLALDARRHVWQELPGWNLAALVRTIPDYPKPGILFRDITTLIAGIALFAFGSGPVKGFAVVHCLGILTSMFSAVMLSRALVNLWYGRQKKLQAVSIGTIWRPDSGKAVATRD
jgi:hypothetical protein